MSNPLHLSDRHDRTGKARFGCRPVRPGEVRAALRVILASHGRLASEEQVVDFLGFALQRKLNLNDIWLASKSDHAEPADASQILWAVLPVVSPGRTMLILSPSGLDDQANGARARELISIVCGHWAARGVHLAQSLLEPSDWKAQQLYESCHFSNLAELIYLQTSGRKDNGQDELNRIGLSWQTYSPARHSRFAQAIMRSYENSLDCPALNGKRDIEDIIAGHKAAGEFDPDLWSILCDGDRPLGVLLLAHSRHSEVLELVYLGLAPEARGRGLARWMMARALNTVEQRQCSNLSLAVDSRNVPALKLYYSHGMRRICSKMALLQDLRTRQKIGTPAAGELV